MNRRSFLASALAAAGAVVVAPVVALCGRKKPKAEAGMEPWVRGEGVSGRDDHAWVIDVDSEIGRWFEISEPITLRVDDEVWVEGSGTGRLFLCVRNGSGILHLVPAKVF